MKPLHILTLALLLAAFTVSAQEDRVEAQKQVIASLEKKIAEEEAALSKIQQGKAATEDRARRLARQIDSRKQLLEATEKQADLLRNEIDRNDSVAGDLSATLRRDRAQYAQMVREAYRNYKQNNYIAYIFASPNFSDVARRLLILREAAAVRADKLRDIKALTVQVQTQQDNLSKRKTALESVKKNLSAQRTKLERDATTAKANLQQMSKKEKESLRRKLAQEQQLSVAISELRRMSKGNTEGDSFTYSTSGLQLPVVGGRVKRYRDNMAEVVGPKGAQVISIYEGKVVDVKRNRITNKMDVYVAHGEYITSYANLGSICVQKGQKVAKNQALGTVGSAVDVLSMETEYKVVFGIYPPDPSQHMSAANCFRK